MLRARDRSLAAATLVSLFAAVGCPVFLSDDFQTVPTEPSDGGDVPDAGSGGEGGTSGSGGATTGGTSGLPSAGSAGMTEAGGATAAGGGTFADAAAGGVPSGGGGFDAGSSAGGAPADGGGFAGAGGFAGTGGTCTGCDPRWTPTAAPDAAFAAREQAAYAGADTRVFIWGGADRTGTELQTGAIYDAELDRWTTVPVDANTPSARVLATAVWTGTVFVVWGGGDQEALTDYATGGRYDPASHTWSPMSKNGAPSARRAPYGAWTGSRVLFWGGLSSAHAPVGGAYSYDPENDSWSKASVTGEPAAPLDAAVAWTGSTLLVYGGRTGGTTYTARMDGYDPSKDLWTGYPAGPQARAGALGTWDGVSFVVWGGTASGVKKDGARFSASTWTNLPNKNAPLARYAVHRETGWSARIGDETTLMVGGYDASQNPIIDGTYYRARANDWNAVGKWPSGSAHLWGVGVWAGVSFVLWGGRVGPLGALTTQGERFSL